MPIHTSMQLRSIFTVIIAISTLGHTLLSAQDRYISVTGSSTVSVKPEFVQLTATLKGTGETAEDAIKKIKIVLEEFSQAINPMDFENVTVEYSGITFPSSNGDMNQMIFMGDGEMEPQDPVMTASKTAIITIGLDADDDSLPIEKISKVIDVAKQAKATFGDSNINGMYYDPSTSDHGIMKFKVKDPKSLEKLALKQAMENARSQADELAVLANAKIVRVASVDSADFGHHSYQEHFGRKESRKQEVKVARTLQVRFEISD